MIGATAALMVAWLFGFNVAVVVRYFVVAPFPLYSYTLNQ